MNVVVSTGSSLSWHTFKYLSDPFPQDQIYDHRLQLTGKGMLFLNHTLWSHIDKASSALCTWAVNCVSICFDRCINMRGLSLSLSLSSLDAPSRRKFKSEQPGCGYSGSCLYYSIDSFYEKAAVVITLSCRTVCIFLSCSSVFPPLCCFDIALVFCLSVAVCHLMWLCFYSWHADSLTVCASNSTFSSPFVLSWPYAHD